MNYNNLPFIDFVNSLTDESKHIYYKNLSHIFNQEQISLVQSFHHGNFRLSGTNHFLPDFLVSNNAKNNLFYPQGFLIMEANSDYFTDRSELESYELRFTLEGEGYLEYGNKSFTLKKGEGFFIDCRKHHYYRTNKDKWVSTILHFNGPLAENIFSHYSYDGNVKFSESDCPNFEMLQLQLLNTALKLVPFSEFRISCLFDILLTELLSSKERGILPDFTSSIIQEIISYLRNNFDKDITIEAISHKFGISRSHLSREFKKITGFSPKEYLIQIRISQAKLLLRGSSISIDDLSSAIGFHDTAHFIQTFKKVEGITPLKFRKFDLR